MIKRKFGRLTLELDKNEFFPDDPGQGTPAMVYIYKDGKILASSTYDCACDTGYLQNKGVEHKLTKTEMNWLDSLLDLIDQTFDQWNVRQT